MQKSKRRFRRSEHEGPADGLQFLSGREIRMIDDLLTSVGEFGEVLLSVKDGRLRFAESRKSFDALKYDGRER
jgi:hypothetical protein